MSLSRITGPLIFAALLAASFASAGTCPPAPAAPTADTISQLAAQARDRGFLWKLSKGGRDSWLYGTLHAGKLEWTMPGPRVTAALRQSELLAVELDLSDPVTLEKLGALSRQGAGEMPDALKSRFKAQLDRVCMPESAMTEMNPLLLLAAVELLLGRDSGFEAGYGVEYVLAGYARAAKMKVVPLETAESQMTVLIGPGGTVAVEELDEALSQLEDPNSRQLFERMMNMWSRGDFEDLGRYESWCHCLETPRQRAAMKELLDDRNGPLAASIDALHQQGKSVFAAVGALHMVGSRGLPALLAARGYTVTRVEFQP